MEDGRLARRVRRYQLCRPHLNGIGALVEQAVGGRIGLWNPMLDR